MITIQWLESFMPPTCTYDENENNIIVTYLDSVHYISKVKEKETVKKELEAFVLQTKIGVYDRNGMDYVNIETICNHAKSCGLKITSICVECPISCIIINDMEFYFFNALYNYGTMDDIKQYIKLREQYMNNTDIAIEVSSENFRVGDTII